MNVLERVDPVETCILPGDVDSLNNTFVNPGATGEVVYAPRFRNLCLPGLTSSTLAQKGPATITHLSASCDNHARGSWLVLFDSDENGIRDQDRVYSIFVGPYANHAGEPELEITRGVWVVVASNPYGHPDPVTPGLQIPLPQLTINLTLETVE